jgi:RNA polymerase sigma-70 factor, ECF subfamily
LPNSTLLYRPAIVELICPLFAQSVPPSREAALMGDFGKLLEEQIPRLRRYARALTRNAPIADDLVQDCLVRAVAKQHLWQPGTDLRAWLFTILHNQHVNYVRRSSKEGVSVEMEEVTQLLPIEPNAMPSLELRDLRAALAKLAIEQREAILLVGLEGMDYESTAKVLNVPIGTVRSRLSRGRAELRKLMGFVEPPDQALAAHSPENGRKRLLRAA